MNKNLKKILLAVSAALLLVAVSIGATVAYLTASTADVKNTFVFGNIGELDLDETDSDSDNNTKENEYTIIPGGNITKDPVVTYTEDASNPVAVYIFLKMTPGSSWSTTDNSTYTATVGSTTGALSFTMASGWTPLLSASPNKVYYRTVAAGAAATEQSYRVIANDKITVSTGITQTDVDAATAANYKLDFKAYAIQQASFDSASAAWTAVSGSGN